MRGERNNDINEVFFANRIVLCDSVDLYISMKTNLLFIILNNLQVGVFLQKNV